MEDVLDFAGEDCLSGVTEGSEKRANRRDFVTWNPSDDNSGLDFLHLDKTQQRTILCTAPTGFRDRLDSVTLERRVSPLRLRGHAREQVVLREFDELNCLVPRNRGKVFEGVVKCGVSLR